MLFKKINNFILFSLMLFFYSEISYGDTNKQYKNLLADHLLNIKEFSSSFIQSNNITTETGKIFIKNERIRIEYFEPSNILLILSKNKALYYHKDLEEVEYFNPRKTVANIFFDIFYEKNFLDEAEINTEGNSVVVEKIISLDQDSYLKLIIYFEIKPVVLRKIKIINQGEVLLYSIYNHNFFPELEDKLFSMAHPLLN